MFAVVDNIRVAFIGLRTNKLRSALTMLGITIGVAAVIVLVSIGQAVETYVRDQFQGIGANLLFVIGSSDSLGRTQPLTQRDVNAISDPYRVPEAMLIMPQLNLPNRTVTSQGREALVTTRGVTADFPAVFNRDVIAGRFFDQDDMNGLARVAVIGLTTADRLFPDTFPLGQTIRIQGVRFTVIGILVEAGGAAFGPPGNDPNDLILLPLTTAQTRLSGQRIVSGDRPVSNILVKARDNSTVDLAALQIRQTLREAHGISFRDEDDFQVFTQAEILDSFSSVAGLLTIFLGLIAGISLLVGGIGIMNIMLVTVTERTREIGLRKAVGAQNRDILSQFLVEATVLALVGGGIGVLIAASATALVGLALPTLSTSVQLSSVALATLISAAIGVFFGIYPATRAAALNPIEALRYE